jgi:hypothetical protein
VSRIYIERELNPTDPWGRVGTGSVFRSAETMDRKIHNFYNSSLSTDSIAWVGGQPPPHSSVDLLGQTNTDPTFVYTLKMEARCVSETSDSSAHIHTAKIQVLLTVGITLANLPVPRCGTLLGNSDTLTAA